MAVAPRPRPIPWSDVQAVYQAAQRAVTRVRLAYAAGALPIETAVTGALVHELRSEIQSATTVGAFDARAFGPIDEKAYGADFEVVLAWVTGTKWTLVQAKQGKYLSKERAHLLSQCAQMQYWGSSRALVYYYDVFASAPCRGLGTLAKLPSKMVAGPVPLPWHGFERFVRDFFDCWGGSHGFPPVDWPGRILLVSYGASRDEAAVVGSNVADTLQLAQRENSNDHRRPG